MSADVEALAEALYRRTDLNRRLRHEVARTLLASDWLAEHDAEVKAEGWDEGYNHGFYDRDSMRTCEARDATEGRTDNPYREATR